jgi:hypothetical protein
VCRSTRWGTCWRQPGDAIARRDGRWAAHVRRLELPLALSQLLVAVIQGEARPAHGANCRRGRLRLVVAAALAAVIHALQEGVALALERRHQVLGTEPAATTAAAATRRRLRERYTRARGAHRLPVLLLLLDGIVVIRRGGLVDFHRRPGQRVVVPGPRGRLSASARCAATLLPWLTALPFPPPFTRCMQRINMEAYEGAAKWGKWQHALEVGLIPADALARRRDRPARHGLQDRAPRSLRAGAGLRERNAHSNQTLRCVEGINILSSFEHHVT